MSMLKPFLDQEQRSRREHPAHSAVSLALDSMCSGCLFCLLLSSLEVTFPVGILWSTVISGSCIPHTLSCQSAALQGYFLSTAPSPSHPVIFSLAKSK